MILNRRELRCIADILDNFSSADYIELKSKSNGIGRSLEAIVPTTIMDIDGKFVIPITTEGHW